MSLSTFEAVWGAHPTNLGDLLTNFSPISVGVSAIGVCISYLNYRASSRGLTYRWRVIRFGKLSHKVQDHYGEARKRDEKAREVDRRREPDPTLPNDRNRRAIRVKIWNSGRQAITRSDFDDRRPIEIPLVGEELWYARVSDRDPSYLPVDIRSNSSASCLKMEPLLLNSKDSLKIDIITWRRAKVGEVRARIAGIRLPELAWPVFDWVRQAMLLLAPTAVIVFAVQRLLLSLNAPLGSAPETQVVVFGVTSLGAVATVGDVALMAARSVRRRRGQKEGTEPETQVPGQGEGKEPEKQVRDPAVYDPYDVQLDVTGRG
jgi:hypothetical protein